MSSEILVSCRRGIEYTAQNQCAEEDGSSVVVPWKCAIFLVLMHSGDIHGRFGCKFSCRGLKPADLTLFWACWSAFCLPQVCPHVLISMIVLLIWFSLSCDVSCASPVTNSLFICTLTVCKSLEPYKGRTYGLNVQCTSFFGEHAV